MKLFTKLDKELYEKILEIDDGETYLEAVFLYCESQKDRKRLLKYIEEGNTERKAVLLMASQIGIESGVVEGELLDDEEPE